MPGQQCRDQAVDVRDADAQPDEREHVQAAVDDRLPGAHEERPAAPEHDRRGEGQLHPAKRGRRSQVFHEVPGEIVGHRHQDQRGSERRADPEPPGHVHQFGILFVPPPAP